MTPSSAPAALAILGGEVWIGGDGFVSLGDGSRRIDVRGPVLGLSAGDGMLWVRGSRWIAAIDPEGPRSLGSWLAESIVGDAEPLPGRRVAVSLSSGEVAVVGTGSEGLEVRERLHVGRSAGDLLRTTGGELWVATQRTISRVDIGSGRVSEIEPWAGALLAASLDGGIWTTDAGRVLDLRPSILQTGALSASEGVRYDVTATMAVETPFGLYVGGPGGVRRYSPKTPLGEVIDAAAPSALDASGGQIAYVVAGRVRTAMARGETVDSEAWRREPNLVAARYLGEVLKWPDPSVRAGSRPNEVHAESLTLRRDANVGVEQVGGHWAVTYLWTFGAVEHGASMSLGYRADRVIFDYAEAGLTPELTIRYGDHVTTRVGQLADWGGDLGYVPGAPGFVQVLFRDAQGRALEGWAMTLHPGPLAAG